MPGKVNRYNRRNSNFKGKRFRGKKNNRYRHREKDENKTYEKCAICGRDIKNTYTAIMQPETGNKVHFDCAISDIRKQYKPSAKEKIYYLGKGIFGIVEEKRVSRRKIQWVIKQKIDYEHRKAK